MRFFRYAFRSALQISKEHLASPRVKGFIGEKEVKETLKEEKFLINNIVIKEGVITQIDHIVINERGIFVIETKNYRGLIKAKVHGKFWVQYINKKQYPFYNPLVQNNFHLEVLGKLFPEFKSYLKSVVVFTNNARLAFSLDNVTLIDNLKSYLSSFRKLDFPLAKQKEIYSLLIDLKDK